MRAAMHQEHLTSSLLVSKLPQVERKCACLLSCWPPRLLRSCCLCSWPISATTLPGIEQLTALESLTVSGCDLELFCLLSVTRSLPTLRLTDVTLQPSQVQPDGTSGTSQLLQLLTQLTALRTLELQNVSGEWPQQQQLSLQSAVAASSNVQELEISNTPGVSWTHVFPAGRELTSLQCVAAHAPAGVAPVLDSASISRLAACCPGLRELGMAAAADALLAPLQSLTALTRLELAPASPSAVCQLTALSQLQSMSLYFVEGQAAFGLRCLVPLTVLTALTQLYCAQIDEQQAEEAEDVRDGARDVVFLQDGVSLVRGLLRWLFGGIDGSQQLRYSTRSLVGASTCTLPCWRHAGCLTCVSAHTDTSSGSC